MTIQAYVDESGCGGQGTQFTFVALIAEAQPWALFSDAWAAVLGEEPCLAYFKLSEASNMKREFHRRRGMTERRRDERVRKFGRVLNDCAPSVIQITIDLEAHKRRIQAIPGVGSMYDVWVYGFYIMISTVGYHLLAMGASEPCEIFFDEHDIFAPRARADYEKMLTILRGERPDAAALLPFHVSFKDDKEYLPLQASDMLAWKVRRHLQRDPPGSCDWVFSEMPALMMSNFSRELDAADIDEIARIVNAKIAEEGG